MPDGCGTRLVGDALQKLDGDSHLRTSRVAQGRRDVKSYDMRRVERRFMETASIGTREGEIIAQ